MTVTTELKKTATDTGYAVVGITDLAVERIRGAQAVAAEVRGEIEKVRVDTELKKLQTRVQQLPAVAEDAFDSLASRGKSLVQRIANQPATQDLLTQGKNTLSRGKAAATTTRRGAKSTKSAAKATVTTAEREADQTTASVKQTVRQNTQGTRSAAKRTTTTATRRAAASKSAAKGAATSARKTAKAAGKATEAAAKKVGD